MKLNLIIFLSFLFSITAECQSKEQLALNWFQENVINKSVKGKLYILGKVSKKLSPKYRVLPSEFESIEGCLGLLYSDIDTNSVVRDSEITLTINEGQKVVRVLEPKNKCRNVNYVEVLRTRKCSECELVVIFYYYKNIIFKYSFVFKGQHMFKSSSWVIE